MHILLSSEETLYQVSTHAFSAKGRAEQISAELFYPTKKTLLKKQAQEQTGYITTAAQAAYASLNKLDWTKTFYGYVELTPNTQDSINFDGNSSGLGYALALALEWRKQLNKPTDYEAEVFATGEIHSSGAVTEIGHLETKITAACNFMEKKNTAPHAQHSFVIFYPKSNQYDVTTELQTRVDELGGKLCPVERLQSALTTLLGDAYDGDAEGRWEPFKGLLSFNYEDSLRFFGRERALTKLNKEFNEAEGLLVVTGVSGSGKSSLIKAGLIPQINKELPEGNTLDWLISTPKAHNSVESILLELLNTLDKHWSIGTNSKDNSDKGESDADKDRDLDALSKGAIQSPDTFIAAILQAQLLQPNKLIFYYIDQYEDIFNHQDISREQAQQLAPLLASLVKQIPNLDIVISIRSEYEDILGKYGSVSHVNPELNASEWGDIVYKQATSFGLRYEPELEKRIVDEASSIQHALPALEYLLEQLYKKAKKVDENARLLTHEHYEQLKGIKGVIAARAEEVIAKHPMQAHAFFEYFVGLNNENKPYAKSVNIDAVQKVNEALYNLIQAFIDAQLVVDCSTNTEKRVKLAHDTLFNFDNEDSAWTALKAWFEESQAYLQWLNVISGDFKRWSALEETQESSTGKKDNLSTAFLLNDYDLSTGHKFLQANLIQQPKVREYIAQSQQQKETLLKQKNKKQRLVILLVSVFCLIAVGAGLVAYQKKQEARSSELEAKRQTKIAVESDKKKQKALLEANHNYALALNQKAETYAKNNNFELAKLYALNALKLSESRTELSSSLALTARDSMESTLIFSTLSTSQPTLYPKNKHKYSNGVHFTPHMGNFYNHIEKIKYSQNGEFLVTTSRKGEVRIWSIKTGKSRLLVNTRERVKYMDISPDSKYIVFDGVNNSICVWSIETSKCKYIHYKKQELKFNNIDFSDDGKFIFFNGAERSYTWSMQTNEFKREKYIGNKPIIFLPDNKTIATFDVSRTVKTFNIESKKRYRYIVEKDSVVTGNKKYSGGVTYIASSNSVAFSFGDEYIRFTSLNTGKTKSYKVHDFSIESIALSPDGLFVYSGDIRGHIQEFEIKTGKSTLLLNHSGSVQGLAVSPSGQHLAIGGGTYDITLFDLYNRKRLVKSGHSSVITSVAYSNNGRFVASSSVDGLNIWDIRTGAVNQIYGHGSYIDKVVFSKSDKYTATSSWDKTIQVWDWAKKEKKSVYSSGHIVRTMEFLNDNNVLVLGDSEGGVIKWDIETNERLTLRKYTSGISDISISDDNKLIALALRDGSVRLLNLETKHEKFFAKQKNTQASSVTLSSNKKQIITAYTDGKIRIWDVDTHEYIVLKGHKGGVEDIDISFDGKLLVSASSDHTVRLWDLNNSNSRIIGKHFGSASSVSFSPDAKTIVSGAYDNQLRIWGLKNDTDELFFNSNIEINSFKLSPDGTSLITTSKDSAARMWDMNSSQYRDFPNKYTSGQRFSFNDSGDRIISGRLINWEVEGEIKIWDFKNKELTNWVNFPHIVRADFVPYRDMYVYINHYMTGDMFSIYSYDLNAKKGSKVKDLFSSRSDFDYSISPSGEWLAMKKSYENKIILVNPSTGKRKQLFEVSHQLKEYTFSSDGHSIFTVTTDNNIYQWDIKSGEFNFLYKYDEQIYHLHNSPDGSLLMSLTNGGSILIIELDTLSHRIIKPTQKPIDIEFSIDGKNIITLTNKNELQKFNVDKLFIDSLEIKDQIYKSELKLNVKLQGVELVKTTESLNLYNKPPNKPSWPKHHPFHWQEKSEQGDPEALLQLGIIAQRDKEWDKAKDYYQKAKTAGHKNADYRLKINELMRKEYSKEPVH